MMGMGRPPWQDDVVPEGEEPISALGDRGNGTPLGTAKHLLIYAIFALSLYVGTATTIFAFRHPHLTSTELILHLPEALTFQTLDTE